MLPPLSKGNGKGPQRLRQGKGLKGQRPYPKRPKGSKAALPAGALPHLAGVSRLSIVITAGGNQQRFIRHRIHKPMLGSDPPRPEPRQVVAQRLRLALALERGAAGLLDQLVDLLDHPLIRILPVQIIFPGLFRPDQLHSAISRSAP